TILFMGAILMMFVAFISAIVVSKMDGFWVNLKLPSPFYWSTVIILLSSITYIITLKFAKKNNQTALKSFLGITFLLGIGFIYFQIQGWKQMVASGNFFTGGIYFEKGAYGDKF